MTNPEENPSSGSINSPLSIPVLGFTAIKVVLNTAYRMVYPFLGVFRDGMGVSLPMLSLALTARSVVGALGPFLASVADNRGRKLGMLMGLLLFIAGASLVVFWPSYPTFVLALLLTILGKYAVDPAIQAYLGDRTPYQRRGAVLAVTEIGWSLGFIVGVPLMGLLIARRGWNAPFLALALVGLLALGGVAWLLPRDSRPVDSARSLMGNLRAVFTYEPALAGLSLGIFVSMANEVVNVVFGIWLEDSFGLKIAALGAASAVIGVSELCGETLVGTLTDRLGKMRAIGLGLALNSLAALALPLLGRNTIGAVTGLFFFYITFEFTLVSTIPLMSEILPGARATLMATHAAAFSLGRGLGAILAPFLFIHGIWANIAAVTVLNLLAFGALHRLKSAIRSKVGKSVTAD